MFKNEVHAVQEFRFMPEYSSSTYAKTRSMEELPMTISERIRSSLANVSAYLILLIQQVPTMGLYVGLMTLPIFLYLIVLFSQYPMNFIMVLFEFASLSFLSIGALIANLIVCIGFIIIVYSVVYLYRRKNQGLVATGPYRYIRHPQYTGFILFTLGLTGCSYYYLAGTFGVGWLSKEATIAVWFVQLGAYIALALIEDLHLSRKFGEVYDTYKGQVAAFFPFSLKGRYDMPISIGAFSAILLGLILIQYLGTGTFVFL